MQKAQEVFKIELSPVLIIIICSRKLIQLERAPFYCSVYYNLLKKLIQLDGAPFYRSH